MACGGLTVKPAVETFQTPFELEQLLCLVDALAPERVLEVGSWDGGTLWHWLQTASSVVAIDDQMRAADLWREWALEAGADLELLHGRSQDLAIAALARDLGPYDLVFIDADHSYESVRADWVNFSPLAAPGGMAVLHDIGERPGYGVSKLWAEIKGRVGVRTVEIVETSASDEQRNGIGVVWL